MNNDIDRSEQNMLKDFKFFLDNIEKLYEQYGNKYVAIKNERILGAYSSIKEAVETTSQSEKFGTFIVQQCAPNAECVTAHFAGNVIV